VPLVKIYIEPGPAVSYISSHLAIDAVSEANCDFILSVRCPWGIFDPIAIQAALDAPPCYSKPVLAFLISDCTDDFQILNNVTLFRLSLYKSRKSLNERLLPYIWTGAPPAFEPIRTISEKPVVGFCGVLSGNRAPLIAALEADDRVRTNFVIRDKFWGGKPHDPQLIKEFDDNIERSLFTVCCRGRGNFSMRFYQVLAAGRIPVIVHQDMEYPFEDEVDWDNYLVRGDSNEEVIEKLIDFWKHRDLEQVQIACRKIYETYFLPRAFLERTLRSFMVENCGS